MTIVEFDPSQFEGKDGGKKFREWLKGLTRVQLLELYDMDTMTEEHWDIYFGEENRRAWPIDRDLRDNSLSRLFKDFTISGSKKEENTFEAILDRLEPQVAGIQKKLNKLLKLMESKEVTMSMKTALSL